MRLVSCVTGHEMAGQIFTKITNTWKLKNKY